VKIKWLGHSCFLLTSEAGTKVLTDPFDNQVGYSPPAVEADIVTTSHNHFDHNHIQIVKGDFKHISQSGEYEHNGVGIKGVKTFHDEVQGAKRGVNMIYIFDMDSLRVCHCGDLGHIPSQEQAAEIGPIDILLIPVGGTFTVNANKAMEVVKLLKPAVTVPMHYKTPALGFNIDGVDKFLAAAGISKQQAYLDKQEIDVKPESLGLLPKIIVLSYA
jgi:L-ascorbate metabolism protein UlaG (beta-lactamase superfamily)